MTSRYPVVTIKFLDNEMTLDQTLAKIYIYIYIYVMANSSCCVYVNTTSEVKNHLDESSQDEKMLQKKMKHIPRSWGIDEAPIRSFL